jgi:phage portal protein BeeE
MPDLAVVRRALPGISTRAPRTSPRNVPQSSVAVAYTYDGKVGKPDARMYRHWSTNSEWIRGAVNIRRTQVSSAEWDIVPYDKNKPYSKREQKAVKALFMRPNPANDSFRSFIEPIVEDIIVLDAGVVEKVRSLDGQVRELWPVDGASIKVNANWDGSPEESRYFWYPDYKERATFKNADMLYMMANPRTNSPVGLSGLETLKQVIESELYGHEYNRRQVAGAAPDGVLDLGEGMTQPDVEKYRSYFESEVAGRGAIGFIGGSKGAKWLPFRATNRDMQFLEWQIYLVRKIAVVLGLTPQDLGVTFDVNRSTSETQIQISEDRGLRPLMTLLQEYVTEEVIWDRAFGGPDNNLAFRFTALNLKESTAKAAILHQALAGVPWRFINEARLEEGREPIKELENKLIMATPTGAVDIMDIPTVREQMDEANKAKAAAKPAPPTGNKDLDSALRTLATMADRPQIGPPQVHIDKGAVEVNVASAGPPPINVTNHMPEQHVTISEKRARKISRATEYQKDEEGRIIGKVEIETDANDPTWKRMILTKFVTDDNGNVTGKDEQVIESDDVDQ